MSSRSRIRRGVALLALLAGLAASPLVAQEVVPPPTPHADRLAAQMRILADNPKNLDALIEAGRLSVKLAEPQAALQFFHRAEEIAPNDPRVAAGQGAALVSLERPGEALQLFARAEQLGMAPAAFASDRGLAYDLIGRQDYAQRDYRLALTQTHDDDTIRRYALSLGISGKREEASKLLEPLLRQQDRAAWRAQAMILAMSGDMAGADKIAAVMLPNFGPNLAPFFRRLPALDARDKAFAVHFGRLSPGPVQVADARLAPQLPPLPPDAAATQFAATPGNEGREKRRKRPSRAERRALAAQTAAQAQQRASAAETPVPLPPLKNVPAQTASVTPAPSPAPASPPPPPATPSVPVSQPVTQPMAVAPAPPVVAVPMPPAKPATPDVIATSPVPPSDAVAGPLNPSTRPATPPQSPEDKRFAEALANFSLDAVTKRTPPKAKEAEPPKKAEKPKKTTPDPAHLYPARHWVQVAGGANDDGLGRTWKRLVDKAPDAFKGKTPWTTPLNATNRLLTGPFDSDDAAQDFVNRLAKAGLSAFPWTSDAGQKIDKLKLK